LQENHVSLTAIMTAYMRAYHAMNDTPKIFDDFLAFELIPEERRVLIEQGLASALQIPVPEAGLARSGQAADALRPFLQAMGLSHVLSRSRYAEDNLELAVQQGIGQYVILGAGLDTFAFRRPDLLRQLQVFEADHPATQAFKRDRLAELKWETPSHLHFVPVDFTKERLADALKRTAYDVQTKSFFSWLGVTMYLTRDEVFATLRSIAEIAPAGSAVIFDYFVPEEGAPHDKEMREELSKIGEPMKTALDPSTLAVELERVGLRLHENASSADIQERYFQNRTDGYQASCHVRFAWAVVT
jgi:methyltransferase (TIGR00027 family)